MNDQMNKSLVASISVCGEMVLNLHSLNNEGGEGNHILTRQLTILDKNGRESVVTGISGDMFKHIHAGHMINYCVENNISLSDSSKKLNPNRISSDELKEMAVKTDNPQKDVIDVVIKKCAICDTHGILLTDKMDGGKNGMSISRKSVIEFAWTVGIPEKNNTESYIHTKVVTDGSKGGTTATNEGQNIFYRPANYGSYAFICNIDVYRIGLNDIDREYSISDKDRIERYKAIIQSLLSTILNPKGAMTSTQKPHITDFKGVVSISHNLVPAPIVSAINPDYVEEMRVITENLNKMTGNAIELRKFNSLGGFVEIMQDLYSTQPYKIGSGK